MYILDNLGVLGSVILSNFACTWHAAKMILRCLFLKEL